MFSATKRGPRLALLSSLAPVALLWPGATVAQAQAQAPAPPSAADRQSIERQIEEIRAMKAQMSQQMGELDARIDALEIELQETVPGISIPPPEAAPPPQQVAAASALARSEEAHV